MLSPRGLSVVIKDTAVPVAEAVLLHHHSVGDAHEGPSEQHNKEDEEQRPNSRVNALEEGWAVLRGGVGQTQQVPKCPAR